MAEPIQVDYNTELAPLVEVLSKVKRPGDFYATGSLEVPLPRLEIQGVGTISFPLPESQAKEIIRQAEQAPYGRGQETVVDSKVRKVWQVPAGKVRLGGTSWEQTLSTILERAAAGMSFKATEVTAELYKLLLYDVGSFFLAHRDTEKAAGMFGTLVVVLPSFHQGGELVVRHAGREVTLDLRTKEVSELTFAAFYADCEHEVRRVTQGNRLCLVYNLIQRPSKKRRPLLAAPDYIAEIERVAKVLKDWSETPGTPPKIAYLLEHQYSPAGLSFAGLKNADAALGRVLCAAARQVGFAIHLGIVHLEESGAAESFYDPYYSRRRRYGRYYEEEEEEEAKEDVNADFEIVEVCDGDQYIDSWSSPTGAAADYGKIPLGEGELLPKGALDNEPPDHQRVTEATGNEGASFERSYHRAALVLWRQDRYPEVLLQGGVPAVLPYLRERIRYWSGSRKPAKSSAASTELTSLAKLIIDHWKSGARAYGYSYDEPREPKTSPQTVMLGLLRRMRSVPLLKEFISRVVVSAYDGNENAELVKASGLLGPSAAGELLTEVIAKNMALFHVAGAELLSQLVQQPERKPAPDWAEAYRQMATAAVEGLSRIKPRDSDYGGLISEDWVRRQKAKPVSAALVANLFDALWRLNAADLSATAADTIISHPKIFAPDTVLVPALTTLQGQHPRRIAGDPVFQKLWQQAAEFLLERSEFPPAEPADWAQPARIGCKCEDCRELQAFVRNPAEQVHRFRVAKERRRHLHGTIECHQLDMTHATERIGSPQTLVCTKTRKHFQERCRQYAREIDFMKELAALGEPLPGQLQDLVRKLRHAISRSEGSI